MDSSDLFTALGDIYGLFIIVKAGRVWFPTLTTTAVVAPVRVTIRGTQEQHYHISPFLYNIDVLATAAQ